MTPAILLLLIATSTTAAIPPETPPSRREGAGGRAHRDTPTTTPPTPTSTSIRLDAFFTPPSRSPILDTTSHLPLGEDHAAPGFSPLGPALRARARTTVPLPLPLPLPLRLRLPLRLSFTASLETRLDGFLDTRPAPVAPPSLPATTVARAHIPEAFLHLESRHVFATLGRHHPLPYGRALRGNLLLNSDSTPPLDALSLGVNTPRRMLTADAFAARLEGDRGHPLFAGQRVTFTPPRLGRTITLSAQRTLICCESGSGVRPSDVIPILLAEYENTPGHRLDFDQLASVSLSASLPRPLARATHADARAWVEYGGTDLFGLDDVRREGGFPRAWPGLIGPGTVVGAIASYRNLELRAEGARVDVTRLNFHAARRYPEGYTWQERPLAHPAGGRSRSFLLEAEFSVAPGASIGAFASEERYNLHTEDRARRTRFGLQLAAPAPTRPLRTTLRVQTVEEHTTSHTRYAEALLTLELGPFR